MKSINKTIYQKPTYSVMLISIEEGIAAGSATVYTGWDTPGSENAPKETLWENGWDHTTNFDL